MPGFGGGSVCLTVRPSSEFVMPSVPRRSWSSALLLGALCACGESGSPVASDLAARLEAAREAIRADTCFRERPDGDGLWPTGVVDIVPDERGKLSRLLRAPTRRRRRHKHRGCNVGEDPPGPPASPRQ